MTLAERVAERLRLAGSREGAYYVMDDADVQRALPALADLVEAQGRYDSAWNDLNVPGDEGDQALIDARATLSRLADALGVKEG